MNISVEFFIFSLPLIIEVHRAKYSRPSEKVFTNPIQFPSEPTLVSLRFTQSIYTRVKEAKQKVEKRWKIHSHFYR